MTCGQTTLSRRSFLGTATAGTAITSASVAATAQQSPTVELTDDLVFNPDSITVSAGDTVAWENVGQAGHSVTAYEDRLPDDANYFASGGFDAEGPARDAYPQGEIAGGETFEHTFEVPGTYEYFCIPHEGAGMVGTVKVESDNGEPAEATPGSGQPILPANPFTPLVLVAVVVVAAAVTLYRVFKTGAE